MGLHKPRVYDSVTSYFDFIHTTPTFLDFNWSESFKAPGQEYRIVHMLRDPFDVIISGYLYHNQVPAQEVWINYRKFSIIMHDKCQQYHEYLSW